MNKSVVKVADGRGFVAGNGYVITAAHCIPVPIEGNFSELIQLNLLGPLDGPCDVAGEIFYFNSVDDVAIIGPPDDQRLSDEPFCKLVLGLAAMPIGAPAGKLDDIEQIFALGLDGKIRESTFTHWYLGPGPWWRNIFANSHISENGMSGSPIWNSKGEAIALVSMGQTAETLDGIKDETLFVGDGPHPLLCCALPKWFDC